MQGDPIYDLRNLTKRYGSGDTEVVALNDVSLRIDPGQFLVIAGPSGSGKTTLLQLLGGLDRSTSGELHFEGRDMSKLADADLTLLRLEAIGFVFQQFNLIPTLTAHENVEVALAPRKFSSTERNERVTELLGQVGLEARAGHLPAQLSGGEQQRVAIARALANSPRVLLADEPTGNLDTSTSQEVMTILRELSSKHGQTIVLITHDPEIADGAPRLVRMQDGSLLSETEETSVIV